MAIMEIKTTIFQLDADWLLIAFEGTKPPPEKRAFWLNKALAQWLTLHPDQKARRTLPVQDGGELLGVHVWLSARLPVTKTIQVKVKSDIVASHSKEHLEAFLAEAYEIFFERCPESSLAVINRHGIVALFDRTSEEMRVARVEELKTAAADRAKIERWLANPDSHCLVLTFG